MGILGLSHPIFKGGLSNTEFHDCYFLHFYCLIYGCYSLECFLGRGALVFYDKDRLSLLFFPGQRKDIPQFFLLYPYGGVRAQEMASMISICHGPAN